MVAKQNIHTYIQTDRPTYITKHKHTSIHANIQRGIHIHTYGLRDGHAYIYDGGTCIHTYVNNPSIHPYIHTYTHACIHAYIHTIYIYTHMQ